MRKFTLCMIALLMLCAACDQPKTENGKKTTSLESEVSPSKKGRQTITEDDCIFDRRSQNDDFIKVIEEIDHYIWDSTSYTATIPQRNGDTLYLYRGGCTHFSVGGRIRMYQAQPDFKNDEEWIKIGMWVVNLLEEQMDRPRVEEALLNGSYKLENYGRDSKEVVFEDDYLIQKHYSIGIRKEQSYTEVEAYYYDN